MQSHAFLQHAIHQFHLEQRALLPLAIFLDDLLDLFSQQGDVFLVLQQITNGKAQRVGRRVNTRHSQTQFCVGVIKLLALRSSSKPID